MRVKVTFVPMEGMPHESVVEVEQEHNVRSPQRDWPYWYIHATDATYYFPERLVFSVAVERGD